MLMHFGLAACEPEEWDQCKRQIERQDHLFKVINQTREDVGNMFQSSFLEVSRVKELYGSYDDQPGSSSRSAYDADHQTWSNSYAPCHQIP